MGTFPIAGIAFIVALIIGISIGADNTEEIEKRDSKIRELEIDLKFAELDAKNNMMEVEKLKSKIDSITRAKSNGCTPSDACVGCKHALYDVKLSSGQTGFICTKNPPCEGFERKEKEETPPIVLSYSYPVSSYWPIYSSLAHPVLDATYFSCQNAIRM